ncbi:MAG: hypothetical protein ACOX1P_12355 [Thermoguttaceae bacterium]|jgi:hypothetical protein
MHTVELLKEAAALARRAGYRIRQEYLGGALGGGCEYGGQKWIFLDISLGPSDQLEQIANALRQDPAASGLPMPDELRRFIGVRKSA